MMQHKYFPPEWDAGIFKNSVESERLIDIWIFISFLPFGWVNIVRLAWIHSQRQTVLSLEKVSEIYPTAVWVFPNTLFRFTPQKWLQATCMLSLNETITFSYLEHHYTCKVSQLEMASNSVLYLHLILSATDLELCRVLKIARKRDQLKSLPVSH